MVFSAVIPWITLGQARGQEPIWTVPGPTHADDVGKGNDPVTVTGTSYGFENNLLKRVRRSLQ
jgi:hypothetical protein